MKNIERFDTVTGLPYYDSFIGIARDELANNFVPGHYVLIATDISNFKYINHIYGYSKANELLRDLIALISNSDDGNVSTCRTHSDHIISLFKYNGDKTAFCSRVDRYSRDFVKDNNRKYPSIMLHLNNGILFIDEYNDDLIYCIDKANVARRRAKGNYCVSSVIFSDDMMDKEEEDAKILAVFDTAIKNGNIKTFYQPKINIRTYEINGAEVLSRIYDSNGKMLYPDTYIPVLENSGKVVELDRYVMREAFASVRKWIDMGWKVVPVSINLSRMHFYENNVADNIYNEFRRYNIPVEYVELELTRLPYDRYFVRQAQELIRNQLKRPVMISLDISNFKYFNRMYGYKEGDRLISRMVECFCHNNADCVLAYRIYVDHIIILIEAEGLPEKVFKAKYNYMLSCFSEKTNMEFPLARIRLYLGAYYVEDRDEDIGIIIDKSQYARRSIKKNYLTGIAIFRADMEKKAVDEAKIIPMFYSALENDRIEVYIQPKFSIDDERLIGGEALSRIMDNDGNIISPGMYIDILERTNLISKLDGYVIRKLIAIQKKWMDEGRPLTTISLNLSRVDLLEQGFVDGIHQAIVESGVPSGYFEFELTETVFCENITEITKQIDFLKEKGYKISMDDFGSGYNSLYMLGKIPVDIIKFDRGFVLNSLHGETGRTIMKNLIHTFTDVDFEIICEGIENREEESIVYSCGCNAVQGYLHDKPLPYYIFADKYLLATNDD